MLPIAKYAELLQFCNPCVAAGGTGRKFVAVKTDRVADDGAARIIDSHEYTATRIGKSYLVQTIETVLVLSYKP